MTFIKKTALLLTACSCLALNCTALFAGGSITEIATDQAPKAIGPYSQAVIAGSNVYVSGQIAMDPKTGKLVGETIEEQTKQVLRNMEAILLAHGLTLENVVKTDVYMKDLKDFQVMNSVYAVSFSHAVKPARATVQVSKLPLDALVEISCVAYIPDHS